MGPDVAGFAETPPQVLADPQLTSLDIFPSSEALLGTGIDRSRRVDGMPMARRRVISWVGRLAGYPGFSGLARVCPQGRPK